MNTARRAVSRAFIEPSSCYDNGGERRGAVATFIGIVANTRPASVARFAALFSLLVNLAVPALATCAADVAERRRRPL